MWLNVRSCLLSVRHCLAGVTRGFKPAVSGCACMVGCEERVQTRSGWV